MLSKDRATLRNVVLTAAVAMSGALIVGTVWLGGHKTVPVASTTVTAADDTRLSSVGGTGAPLPSSATTITSTTYNVTNDNRRVEGSSASGATTDTARQEVPQGSAPAAVQVRGNPVVVAPATGEPVQQQTPAMQAAPAAVPVVVPAGNGYANNANNGNTGNMNPPTPVNATVPAVPTPSAVTPGYGQVQQGGPPPVGVPQTTATAQPVAPPATGTPPPVPTAAAPQTGLGTGFAQGSSAPR